MNTLPGSLKPIRRLLETDRSWSAYALADLDPRYRSMTKWFTQNSAVAMIYSALNPPVLFVHGESHDLEELFQQIPPGKYSFMLTDCARMIAKPCLRILHEDRMWRMVFKEETFLNKLGDQVTPLGPSHLDAILALFNGHADRPDAFSRDQLENGIFYGVFEGRELLSVAGTHVKSKPMRVGAIGNVFTRPDRRRQGMATRTSAAVVKALLSSGIDTIVLNVSMGNEPALRCYRNLGFWPYCGYYEGVGEIINVNNRNLEN